MAFAFVRARTVGRTFRYDLWRAAVEALRMPDVPAVSRAFCNLPGCAIKGMFRVITSAWQGNSVQAKSIAILGAWAVAFLAVVAAVVAANNAWRYRDAYHRTLRFLHETKEYARVQDQRLADSQATAETLKQKLDQESRYVESLYDEIAIERKMRSRMFVAAYQREEIKLNDNDTFHNFDGGNYSTDDTEDRQKVDCKERMRHKRTAILFILGQSNAANTIDGRLSPSSRDIINFDPFSGKCFIAREPLLGPTNYAGNFATRLADKLIERDVYQVVIIANIAVGGSKVEDWGQSGRFKRKMLVAIKRLHDAGLEPSHVLWHQGEANVGDNRMDYRTNFLDVFSVLRRHGIYAPIYVAQTTVCVGKADEEVRAGQRGLVDPAKRIFAGPDTDQIALEDRYDGCHFSERGADRAAELWFKILDE